MSNPTPLDPTSAALLERYDSLLERISVLAANAITASAPDSPTESANGLRINVLLQVANLYAGLASSLASSVGGSGFLELEALDD